MISLESMRRIEDICSAFERTGELGGEVVNSLLDQIDAAEQTNLATELISLDSELRVRAGQSPSPGDYWKVLERPGVQLTEPQLEQLVETAKCCHANASDQPAETPRYQFLERLGRGAYGDVWRVNDKVGGRPLAVKVLRKSLLDDPHAGVRLLREAQLTGRLQHPGIPPVYDYGTFDDGTAFYSMKLVGGATLESLLNERMAGDHELQRSLTIFHSVVQTMAYAHASGIIHRDLKPHNIMVGDFGEVQVMDWGMAKSIDDAREEPVVDRMIAELDDLKRSAAQPQATSQAKPVSKQLASGIDTSTSLTTDGDVLGTPAYMSPEQARGEKQTLDARSDIFSLGAILYRILNNKRLHHEDSPLDAIRRTAEGDFANALSELNAMTAHPDLTELCRRCLSTSPEERPDAREVSRSLDKHFVGVERRARQAEIERREVSVRQAELTRRRRIQLVAACAVAVVSLLGTAVAYWQRGRAVAAEKQAVQAEQQAVTAQQLEAQAKAVAIREAETAAEINDFLLDLLASARPEEHGVDVTVREILDAMLPRIGESFQDNPLVEGTIRRTFGTTYRRLGVDDTALEQLRLAVEAFERVVPLNEEKLLDAQDRLAGILRSRGSREEVDEALLLRQQVLRRRTELFGETDARTIQAMDNLGLVYKERKDYAQAFPLIQRSIELQEANGNVDPISLDFSRYSLAAFAFETKDYQTAERMLLNLLNRHRSNPAGIRLYMQVPTTLALVYQEQGREQEALSYFNEAVESRKVHLGVLHASTLSAMRKLGRHLIAMGEYRQATELLEETLPYHNETHGRAVQLTFSVRESLAQALVGLGRRDEAERVLRETVEILSSERGEDYPNTAKARQQLENFLLIQADRETSK